MSFDLKKLGLLMALLLIAITAYQIFSPPATLVQPIQVSEALKKDGITEQALQNMLVDALSDLRTKAKGVTPRADAGSDEAQTQINLPDFSVPGMGLSVRSFVEFARTLLEFDSSVYGSVTSTRSGYSVDLTLRDGHGESFLFHQTIPNNKLPTHKPGETLANRSSATLVIEQALKQAAMKILEKQSALFYADNLLQNQQDACFSDRTKCDFRELREKYGHIAAGGEQESDKPQWIATWTKSILFRLHLVNEDPKAADANVDVALAELMLSKIDDLTGHYAEAIGHTLVIIRNSKSDKSWQRVLPWAYYNWGVALNDLGCYQAAAEVLEEAVNRNKQYAPAYNALSRSYNALAETSVHAVSTSVSLIDYRKLARDKATTAVKLNPGYQEAYVNLGDASRPLLAAPGNRNAQAAYDGNEEEARKAYEQAIALDVEQAGRAREQLALLPGATSTHVAEQTTKKRPKCRSGLPRSFLEAFGCSDAEIRATANRKNALVSAALSGVPDAAGVCSQLGLRARESDPKKSDQITAMALDVEGSSYRYMQRRREKS
ncbi:tetratricopeptide repeat protein [Paraburkholderia flagellata]|uniref:tetratricopeptide repeat protein n=1 Tax=Paraburkholderia flagellata TaxID=2883241 RepID=UPI001F31FA76|nr:tetratricopeptide repeat protein [Paraburkholderia flagellata]